jgi:hypothetical protein
MPSIENWQTQSIRLTVFPSMEKGMEKLPGWEALVGDPPDQITQQPKTDILDELGKFGKGSLSHRVIPGRVDWNYLPLISDQKMMVGLPEIGPFTEALEEFKPLMIKWLDQCDALIRIAFGANIFLPVDSHENAYKFLDNHLKSVKIDPETSDFHYQINRKRPSKTLGEQLMINRLSKWRAIKFKLMVQEVEAVESFACALEFDINNVPIEQTTIKKESLADVFCELIDLGIEIASEGDIP